MEEKNGKLIKLPSGLRVICLNRPHFKTTSVRLKVFAGSLHSKNPAVAHFFEHICFQGTKKFPTQKKLNDFCDKNSIYKNAYTNKTETAFYVDGPDLEKVLSTAIELAFNPLITEQSLENERRAVIEEARPEQFSFFSGSAFVPWRRACRRRLRSPPSTDLR